MSDIELSDGKGIAAPQWAPNEELMSEDINVVSEVTYKNYLNLSALLTRVAQTTAAQIFSGLQTTVTGSLTASVSMGMGVSFSGSYFTASGNWGFVANTGSEGFSFVVTNPTAQSITFSANTNASDNRIDIIEIAPTRLNDSNATRNFLDPVTDAVTPVSTPTRYNFSASVIIKQGTPAASPVAPTTDPGYIKLAEVTVPANSGAITQSDVIQFGNSGAWTTNASTTAQYNVVLWNSDVYYHPGEPVFSGGQIYFCLIGNRGNDPSGAPTYWQVFNLASGSPYLNVRQQYISNPGFDSDTSGWNLYTDGGATPTSGSGTFTGTLTFSRNTTNPLFGAGDAILNNNAASQQGSGVAYDFTIDPGNIGQVMMLQFFVESTGAYASGDVGVYIYDKTNAILVPTSRVDVSQGGNPTQWFATWTPSTSTSYRLILHVQTTNASAWALHVDNFNVGPYEQVIGAAIGGWQSYTPSWTTNGTNPSIGNGSIVGQWKRIGSNIDVNISLQFGSSTSLGTGQYFFGLPSGLTIAPTIPNQQAVGIAWGFSSTNNGETGTVGVQYSENAVSIVGPNSVAWWTNSSPTSWTSSDFLYLHFTVPVSQWSDNINLATDFQEFAYNTDTSSSNNTSSFGYGTDGVLVPNTSGTGVSKTVEFQRSIDVRDYLVLEVYEGTYSTWKPMSFRFPYSGGDASSPQYGARILVGTSPSQIVVEFLPYTEWLTSGTNTWGAYYANGMKWRVRKISGGNSAEQPPVVRAKYSITDGHSIEVNSPINFNYPEEDTNSNVTIGSSWKFTATVPGVYLVSGDLVVAVPSTTSGVSSARCGLYLNSNLWQEIGRVALYSGIGSGPYGFVFSATIRLQAGDYISFEVNSNWGGATSWYSGAGETPFVTISRIGP